MTRAFIFPLIASCVTYLPHACSSAQQEAHRPEVWITLVDVWRGSAPGDPTKGGLLTQQIKVGPF